MPWSGKTTLSGLRDADAGALDDLAGFFGHGLLHRLRPFELHLARLLVLAQAQEGRMPQDAVGGEFREGDLGDELRLDPFRAAHLARHLLEGRVLARELLEARAELFRSSSSKPVPTRPL